MTHVSSETAHPGMHGEMSFNWDDIRIFLKVAECKSIRAACIDTGHTHSFVRNRLKELENQIGAILFHRQPTGLTLTETGERLTTVAKSVQRQARAFAAFSNRRQPELRSVVRVGITEGLGVFWLTPMFNDLRGKHPDIQFDLRCSMELPKISELDVDLAIQLEKPTAPELIVRKIGKLHVVLYASEGYIAKHGAPASKCDIDKFHLIEIVGPQIRSEEVKEKMTSTDKRRFVSLRVNSSSAQFIAALSHHGVSAFPTYVPVVSRGLVHVAQDFVLERDIWLAYHPASGELAHVRRTIDWIISSFDPARFPWFRDQFISPAEIEKMMSEQGGKSLFTPACTLSFAS